MGTPTPEQRARSRARAHVRCILTGGPDGNRWIAPVSPEKHGKRWVRNYYGCECDPCRASETHQTPQRRAELRRYWHEQRVRIGGRWVAAHLPPEKHGTSNATNYHGCGCSVCVQADAARRQRRKGSSR